MKNVMKIFLSLVVFLSLTVAGTRYAQAYPTLVISDGISPSITVNDGGPLDTMGAPGEVGFVGFIGVFDLVMQFGFSFPSIGLATSPEMDLTSIIKTNNDTDSGTLTVTLTDTFTTSMGPWANSLVSSIGGTINSPGTVVTYNTYLNGTPTGALGPFSGSGFFGGNTSSAISPVVAPYTLQMETIVTHNGKALTTFDANVSVPEPGTLILLGSGLIGLGFWGIRRKGIR